MIKTVKHYVQPDVRNLMRLDSGSPLCGSPLNSYSSDSDSDWDDDFGNN